MSDDTAVEAQPKTNDKETVVTRSASEAGLRPMPKRLLQAGGRFPCGIQVRPSKPAGAIGPSFLVEGPWNFGDPVHEELTLLSLQKAGLTAATEITAPDVWETVRGTLWNDDPEAQFFDNNEEETANWSNGVEYATAFKSYESGASDGLFYGPGSPMLARSHFGDLACLHAMAAKNGTPAEETLKDIFDWAEFLYLTAAGRISGDHPVSAVMGARMARWFPTNDGTTVRQFLKVGNIGSVPQRALGALLHIVQDSYSRSHVTRGPDGEIIQFLCYLNQDHSAHKGYDAMPGAGLNAIPFAQDAIDLGHMLAQLSHQMRGWSKAKYLLDKCFRLSKNAIPSGAGALGTNMLSNHAVGMSESVSFYWSVTGVLYDDDSVWTPFGPVHDGDQRPIDFRRLEWIVPDAPEATVFSCPFETPDGAEVVLEIALTCHMNSEKQLSVAGSLQLLEGIGGAPRKTREDNQTFNFVLSRGTSQTTPRRLETTETYPSWADVRVTVTNED